MDPQSPTPVSSPQQITTPSSPSKRWPLVGVIIFILILGVIASVVYSKFKENPQSSQKPKTIENKKVTTTGLEIAQNTATFLDKAMLPDGDFIPIYKCVADSCQELPDQPEALSQSNGYIAKAYLDLYKKTGNTVYKDKADKITSFIMDNCKSNPSYCIGSFLPIYSWYKETGDTKYKDALLPTVSLIPLEEAQPKFLWMAYDITGDQKFKNRLETVAKELVSDEKYKNDPNHNFSALPKLGATKIKGYQLLRAGDWLVWAYQASQNPTYLTAAQDVFDSAITYIKVEDFIKTDIPGDQTAIEYLIDLSSVSDGPKKQAYLDNAQLFAQASVSELYDNPTNKKFNGDFGFILVLNNNTIKSTSSNGGRVSQFLFLADRTFHL